MSRSVRTDHASLRASQTRRTKPTGSATTTRPTTPKAAHSSRPSTTGKSPVAEDWPALGAESFWHRPANRYPGCTCPPWQYSPRHPKPTNPEGAKHGETGLPR
jgi:hypothetical protein